jgi:hypothetical protein
MIICVNFVCDSYENDNVSIICEMKDNFFFTRNDKMIICVNIVC